MQVAGYAGYQSSSIVASPTMKPFTSLKHQQNIYSNTTKPKALEHNYYDNFNYGLGSIGKA
jgi:hypothetical protein